MSGPIFWLPMVKMSWEKNSKKKPILLVNFCFLIHFDFSNTRIFSFSIGGKVMSPKMPLCEEAQEEKFLIPLSKCRMLTKMTEENVADTSNQSAVTLFYISLHGLL